MTMPDGIKQDILWYFENYWAIVATIANQRNDVIFEGVNKELGVPIRTNTISDITSKKAIRLTELDLDEMMDWVRVINETYQYYADKDKEKADLIWLTYLEKNPRRKTKLDIMDELFINRDSYYKWLDEICGVAGLMAATKKLVKIC
jgi:hypothetical protein